tara:strand:+ start:3378 stop:4073 length:696 start_codon:yes stop_codon:yes gene_type:complete
MELVKKHILIICSSNSVGSALIKRSSSEGWNISHASRVKLSGEKHHFLDLTSQESILTFCNLIKDGLKIDALIFLCGVLGGSALDQKTHFEIDEDFTINAISQIKIIKNLINHFTDDGRVIFLNSISAFNGSYDPTYAASKAAIIGFIQSMAKYSSKNIRFNAVAAGLIEDSNMAKQFTAEDFNRHRSETPTGLLNLSVEIADIIFDMCGPSWKNMNGQVIHINGGRYIQG